MKLNPFADWKWKRSGTTSARQDHYPSPLRQASLDRLRAVHASIEKGEPVRAGRWWWWETGAAEECGMHCAIEPAGSSAELHAIVREHAHASETLTPAGSTLPDAEAELALQETNAVLAAAGAEGYRAELTSLVEAIGRGRSAEPRRPRSTRESPILELSLQTGRVSAVFPGRPASRRRCALYRRLPRGRELQRSARGVSEALSSLHGQALEGVAVSAYGPGSFQLTVATAEGKLLVRLDRQGARVTSVEVRHGRRAARHPRTARCLRRTQCFRSTTWPAST